MDLRDCLRDSTKRQEKAYVHFQGFLNTVDTGSCSIYFRLKKRFPYNYFRAQVDTIELHGPFGSASLYYTLCTTVY